MPSILVVYHLILSHPVRPTTMHSSGYTALDSTSLNLPHQLLYYTLQPLPGQRRSCLHGLPQMEPRNQLVNSDDVTLFVAPTRYASTFRSETQQGCRLRLLDRNLGGQTTFFLAVPRFALGYRSSKNA